MATARISDLTELAGLHGVQTQYQDMTGTARTIAPDVLLAVLRSLGVPVHTAADVKAATQARRQELGTRPIEPVLVAWDGAPLSVSLRLPRSVRATSLECRLVRDDGGEDFWVVPRAAVTTTTRSRTAAPPAQHLTLPALPTGYHRLTITAGSATFASLILSAPRRTWQPPADPAHRVWGVFAPAYALHRADGWGAGDLTDLNSLMEWTASRGGGLVATLPMLASFCDPNTATVSPYSPASRLFWNEFYLDPEREPLLAHCEAARRRLASADLQRARQQLAAEPLIHYGRLQALKRSVLQELADWFFAQDPLRLGPEAWDFHRFEAERPEVHDYAAFRATGERLGHDWTRWPTTPGGTLPVEPADEAARRYHRFAQWRTDRQLGALASAAREKGLTWYVDLPIGVAASSFDVWRNRGEFCLDASVGCPPDPTFQTGQDWGFRPPAPDRQRAAHYQSLRATIRHHFRHAGALRIDHVMGLHRLYVIPEGRPATDGAFVSYPAEEIWAILAIESHRQGAWLVGENLGTVPPEVDTALTYHGVRKMYVVQYEIQPEAQRALRSAQADVVASINTHDMPPFAAFWQGLDIDDRLDLKLIQADAAEAERISRARQRAALVAFLQGRGLLAQQADPEDAAAVLRACWSYLASEPTPVALLNLEDAWSETLSQNVPNTYEERPNWRRRLRYSLEQIAAMTDLDAALAQLGELRRTPEPTPPKPDAKATAKRAARTATRESQAGRGPVPGRSRRGKTA